MRMTLRFPIIVAALVVAAAFVARADAPRVYAIRGARIVTAAGAPVASGTIVIRDGLIEAVGPAVTAPPDARVIDGAGLTVYPGLIDLGTATGLDVPQPAQPQNPQTLEEVERWKRSVILRPGLRAADHVSTDSSDLRRFAAAGVTSVLARPDGAGIAGQSALVNVVPPPDAPQIGDVGDVRSGLLVVRDRVALHVSLEQRAGGSGGYPVSVMGMHGFVRQAFLDGQHYGVSQVYYARHTAGTTRPVYDASLEALAAVLEDQLPVAFEAGLAREIRRALAMADEFGLRPIVTGAIEADQVTGDLRAHDARVVYSLDYPTRPRTLAPDADEPLRVLRLRANAPKVPAALAQAGVTFGFESAGLDDPKAFVKNAAQAVKDGLPADRAIRALTIDAARIAGADDRLGSLEPGKIANVVVTDGDLFGDETTIKHVFVDGRLVPIEEAAEAPRGGRRAGGR